MLAGDQAAVLAESEESLQELVMRDAKARTDYRLRQNANDKGDGAGEAARCDHNADGEGKGWIGAGRPSEMDVGPGGQKAPRTEGCARFPPNRGGSHEGPDHHAWGGRGPGTRSGLSLPGMGEGSGEGTTTADRAGGGGSARGQERKHLGFCLADVAGVLMPVPGELAGPFRRMFWAGGGENEGESQTEAGWPSGKGLGKGDSGLYPLRPSPE